MAEHHSLLYWLESINLAQYCNDFIQNGLTNREQFAGLDEQTLTNIGITLPGHQRRILTHLPNESNWIENEKTLPNLPPKKKSVRDSFLYQDHKPPDSLSLQKNSGNSDQNTGVDPVKVSPRPVPKPRHKSTNLKSSDLTPNEAPLPNEDKPKPTKRPTPAPRKLVSSKAPKQPENSHPDVHEHMASPEETFKSKDNHLDFENLTFGSKDMQAQSGIKDGSQNVLNLSNSVKLKDVCVGETSTDDSSFSGLFSFPVKENIDKETKDVKGHGDSNDLEEEDLYINIDSSGESVLKDLPARGQEREIAEASLGACCETTEKYENAEFDPFSKTYQVKVEDSWHVSDFTDVTKDTKHKVPEPLSRSSPELCKAGDADMAGGNDGIYEPIWEGEDKKKETVKPSNNHRASSLIQFSPLVTEDSSSVITRPKDKPGIASQNKISLYVRDSASFDMPPPQFAPPPLPSNMANMKDMIGDFDPLTNAAGPDMPPVPPRPSNYTPPKVFKLYENVQFPMGAESATLPGHNSDMEPDALAFPPALMSYQDARTSSADDPFKYEDPFGQFKPDCDGFEPENFPPSSCNINDQAGAFDDHGTAIYEAAEDPDDFDPFGLKQPKPSVTSLPRSISSSSSGSQIRLSEVPPAPKWFNASPESSATYSVAGNIRKSSLSVQTI